MKSTARGVAIVIAAATADVERAISGSILGPDEISRARSQITFFAS